MKILENHVGNNFMFFIYIQNELISFEKRHKI
jgi:hypothetical protein